MKSKFLIIIAILSMALMAAPAMASIFTFNTLPGDTDTAGDPISAAVKVITGAGTVEIQLWNLQTPMLNAGQLLSDFSFVLGTTPTGTVSIFSSGGTERTMLSTAGAYSDSALPNVAPGWGLTTSGASIKLDGLNGAAFTPAHTIIGPDDGAGLYAAANPSIVGVNTGQGYKDAHSPFMFGTAAIPVDWVLTVPGVTAGTNVLSATFSFGTTPGDNHTVPIPASALLLGSGLVGLGLVGWRRWEKKA